MDELHSIIERLAAGPPGRACALATLVHVAGSSYRGIGARALALPDGDTIGLISGGCLEATCWNAPERCWPTAARAPCATIPPLPRTRCWAWD